MKTRSESKKTERSAATPKKGTKDNKLKTPKSEKRKKGSETPLRVDDFLSSQHFGSQIEVGWDCNSPDALRNLQRYNGEHDTGVSEIVMRLLDEEPQEQHSQSPDNLTRISPPPFGLWRCQAESKRPHRKLRPRKKSGGESSLQDTLYESLRRALQNCGNISESDQPGENTDEPGARNISSTDDEGFLDHQVETEINSDDDQVSTDKKLLNYSKDLFDSTKIKDDDKSVTADTENQLDKADSTWSDEELFEDSFIIKATQFPETMKSFNSPLIGMKRKPSDDNVSSKTKSPRYSFQIRAQTDINSNKVIKNSNETKESVGKAMSSGLEKHLRSKPPSGRSNCFGSTVNSKPMLNVTCSLANNVQTKSAGSSKHFTNSECAQFKQNSDMIGSKSASHSNLFEPTSSAIFSSNVQATSSPKNSSFRKHNSFNGQETVKTTSGNLTRQRSFSGANNIAHTNETSSASTYKNVHNFASENKLEQAKNRSSCHATQAQKYKAGVPLPNSRIPVKNVVPVKHSVSSIQSSSMSSLTATNSLSLTSSNSLSNCYSTSVSVSCNRPLTSSGANNIQSLSLNRTGSATAIPSTNLTSRSNYSFKHAFKSTDLSKLHGQPIIVTSSNSVSTSNVGSSKSVVVRNSSVTAVNLSKHAEIKPTEACEEPVEESPVFVAKKRLSTGAFDTSLTDELLCKLAEPDELLDSQLCDTTIKADTKTFSKCANSYSSCSIPGVSRTSTVITVSKNSTKLETVSTPCVAGQNTVGSKGKPAQLSGLPAKGDEKRTYSFKTSQKPPVDARQCDLKSVDNRNQDKHLPSTGFRESAKSLLNTVAVTKVPAPAISSEYSEDLFLSDDDDFLDDGLTEPEILAMLDEVEFLATQKLKTSQESNKKDIVKTSGHNQMSECPTLTPTKYSPSDIERKKNEALKKREIKASQKLQFSQETKLDNHCSPDKVEPSSQDIQLTPVKYSPTDIEKKRAEALKRRQVCKAAQQLCFSQESANNVVGHSPSKEQPLSQGHSSSQSSSDKDLDNSQGHLLTPTKYSPSDIERKRQEALRRKELRSSQETKVFQGHSPSKDLPLSQGQTSSQSNTNEGANNTQVSSSPVKYSQTEIERKKQEALKRRKLKLSLAHSKGK